ncbi:MAG: TonB-dependent receptor [Pseudomonadota bacterium]
MRLRVPGTMLAAVAAMGIQDVSAAASEGGAIEEVVVTARKRAESLQDVPVAVSAFSQQELESQSIQEFVDLNAQTPGVYIRQVQADPSAALIDIRGMSQADTLLTTDASVGVYVDGVNLPRSQGLNANIFDLERVEVLKGPQGTLYGRNTTGGAINLITRKPDYAGWHGYVEGAAGNESYTQFSGAVNVPMGNTAAARLAVQKTDQDGWGESTTTGNELYDQDELFVRGSFMADPTDRLNILLQADYLDVDEGGAAEKLLQPGGNPLDPDNELPVTASIAAGVELGVLNPADIPSAQNPTGGPTFGPGLVAGYQAFSEYAGGDPLETGSDADVYSEAELWGGGLTVSYDLTDYVQVKSITGYRNWETQRLIDLDGSPFTILHPELAVDADFFSQELQLVGANADFDWVLGGFYSHEEGTDGSVTSALPAINPANPNVLDGDVTNKSWAVFAQGTYAVTDRLDVTAGLRYTEEKKELDSFNRTFNQLTQQFDCSLPPGGVPIEQCQASFSDTFSDPSWLLSADYQLTRASMVYASVSRGFRGGGQNIRGGTDPASFTSFEPETATTYEAGFKGDLINSMLRLNAAAYYTDYEDVQRSIIIPGSGSNVITVLTNAAKAEIQGFEAEAWLYPTDSLTFFATAGYTDFEYDEFDSLAQDGSTVVDRSDEEIATPEWQASISARYSRPIGSNNFLAQVDYAWQDDIVLAPESTVADEVTQPDYGLWNARLEYQLIEQGLTFALWGKNLSDEEYFVTSTDFSGNIGHTIGVVGKPRSYGLTVSLDFGDE